MCTEVLYVLHLCTMSRTGHDLTLDSGYVLRLHRLSFSLLTRFLSPSCWLTLAQEAERTVEEEENQEEVGRPMGRGQFSMVGEEAYLLAQQVCANLVDYCYTTMTAG